ncbi:MAG: murein transglycosylase domain-containing protein [Candidatus Stygibacter australis]|nr:murein transglycosylase domain-containing protein [Candidatus Stygibacter australis]
MKRLSGILIILLLTGLCLAQDSYQDYLNEQNQQQEDYINQQNTAFANYHNQQDSLFIQYKDDIEKLWNEFRESTPKDWVSYNEDFSGRSEVSFETGEIKVDAVVESTSGQDEVKAQEIIKNQIVSILQEKDATEEPILADQVKNPLGSGKAISEKDVNELAEQIAKQAVKKEIIGSDNQIRMKYTISLELMPDHIRKRAEKYKPIIENFCQEYQIDPRLALAIAHTESYFNPKAYNRHGNAYGMMQIVPKYAGINMNNVIFHKNQKPSSEELFNPDINLHMGIAYLRWLADNKWQKVTNPTNQIYCMICSYNGGPGTIYKAMTGKMNKIGQEKWDKMINDLSTMDSKKLYNKLRKDVPFEETRNYIEKVVGKMSNEYAMGRE